MTILDLLRQRRAAVPDTFKRGIVPQVKLDPADSLKDTLALGIGASMVVWLLFWWILSHDAVATPAAQAAGIGVIVAFMVWTAPFLYITRFGFRLFKPRWQEWRHFSIAQQAIACLALACLLIAVAQGTCHQFQQRWRQGSPVLWKVPPEKTAPQKALPKKRAPEKVTLEKILATPVQYLGPASLTLIQFLVSWLLVTIGLLVFMTLRAEAHLR